MTNERRHTLTKSGNNAWRYGPWHIEDANWLRPSPEFDVDYWHENYDGPEDGRCGAARSVAACIAEIDEWEATQ